MPRVGWQRLWHWGLNMREHGPKTTCKFVKLPHLGDQLREYGAASDGRVQRLLAERGGDAMVTRRHHHLLDRITGRGDIGGRDACGQSVSEEGHEEGRAGV